MLLLDHPLVLTVTPSLVINCSFLHHLQVQEKFKLVAGGEYIGFSNST